MTSHPVYYDESNVVFQRFATAGYPLTNAEKRYVNRFIAMLVDAGIWTSIYHLALGMGFADSNKARVDWKTGNMWTLVGSLAYTAANGFTTDATTSKYIRTGFIPSTGNGGSTVPLNDTQYSIYVPTMLTTSRIGVIGSNANWQMFVFATVSGNNFQIKHHTSATAAWTSTTLNSGHFYSAGRISSSIGVHYKDLQNIRNNPSYNSVAVPDREVYLGAVNSNGTVATPGDGSYGTFLVNQQTTFDMTTFYVAWQYLMMDLGALAKSRLYPYDMPRRNYSATDNFLLNSEGQSNSMYSGAASGAPLKAALSSVIPNTKTFWAAGGVPGATLTLDPLQYGVNNSYTDLVHHAGGLRAAFELQRRIAAKINVWHYGISGSGLDISDANGWYPTLSGKNFSKSNLTLLPAGLALMTGTIKKLVFHWSQGEYDAGVGRTQAQYTADFYLLLKMKIDRLLANGFNFATTDFHVMIAKIWSGVSGATSIRAAQEAFSIANFEAAYTGYGAYIKTWVNYDNEDLVHSDNLHMDIQGYDIEGYRIGLYMSRL